MSTPSDGFDWAEFLTFAASLVGEEAIPECHARVAGSRAYYALFGCARRWLIENRDFPARQGPDDHQLVWRRFEMEGTREASQVASAGETLRFHRKHADYDASPAFTHARAHQVAVLSVTEDRAERLYPVDGDHPRAHG